MTVNPLLKYRNYHSQERCIQKAKDFLQTLSHFSVFSVPLTLLYTFKNLVISARKWIRSTLPKRDYLFRRNVHLVARRGNRIGWILEGQIGCSGNQVKWNTWWGILAFAHTLHRLGVSISLINKHFGGGREESKTCWRRSDAKGAYPH